MSPRARLATERGSVADAPGREAPLPSANPSAERALDPDSALDPESQLDPGSRLDPESQRWVRSLAGKGHERALATERLHELLLRAARFEVARRAPHGPDLGSVELDAIAQQSADDALVAVLAKLESFRGDSRFTTWAYKFALLEAAVKLRRQRWRDREIPLDPEAWPEPSAGSAREPQTQLEIAELLAAVRAAIERELTAHQREVLIAVALNGVPIDVLAERLGTTRGALYKTIHDARGKLRRALEAEGHALDRL
jgi:RNA polymerase sigma-70 factor (ECF subfamily)